MTSSHPYGCYTLTGKTHNKHLHTQMSDCNRNNAFIGGGCRTGGGDATWWGEHCKGAHRMAGGHHTVGGDTVQ